MMICILLRPLTTGSMHMTVISRARAGLFGAAVIAALAVAPPAAHAGPAFTLSIRDAGVSEAGRYLSPSLQSAPGQRLTNTKLIIDTTAVAGFLTAWVPNFDGIGGVHPAPYCAAAGT